MDPRLTTRFAVQKPIATHRRPATCDEVGCKFQREGWQMHIPVGTPLGERQMALILQSGRRFTSFQESASSLLCTFEPGQQCFRPHSVDIQKPALYLTRQGAGPVKQHVQPADWVDDFSTQLDKIREQ